MSSPFAKALPSTSVKPALQLCVESAKIANLCMHSCCLQRKFWGRGVVWRLVRLSHLGVLMRWSNPVTAMLLQRLPPLVCRNMDHLVASLAVTQSRRRLMQLVVLLQDLQVLRRLWPRPSVRLVGSGPHVTMWVRLVGVLCLGLSDLPLPVLPALSRPRLGRLLAFPFPRSRAAKMCHLYFYRARRCVIRMVNRFLPEGSPFCLQVKGLLLSTLQPRS